VDFLSDVIRIMMHLANQIERSFLIKCLTSLDPTSQHVLILLSMQKTSTETNVYSLLSLQ